MASKKPSQHRNKDGYLEFKKSEGLKKTWKSYHFRVNSTYLLRFKSNDMSNPDGMLLLSDVSRVVPASSHTASFPFEVILRSKGLPWKLNAGSNEERKSWMDAILPGSSKSICQSLMEPPSPSNMTMVQPTGPHSPPYDYSRSISPMMANHRGITTPGNNSRGENHNGTLGGPHADANPYITNPVTSQRLWNEEDEDDDFLTASLSSPSPSGIPQEYILPSILETRSLTNPPRSPGVKFHQPPQRGSSDGNIKPTPSPRPRQRRQTSPHVSPSDKMPSDSSYVVMSSPAHRKRPVQPTTSLEGRQQPSHYPTVVGPDGEPILDENNYVLTEPADSPAQLSQSQGELSAMNDSITSTSSRGHSQGAESGSGASDLVDTISRRFNPDQIGLLISMLQEVRVDKQPTDEDETRAWEVKSPPTSPTSPPVVYGQQDPTVLRGDLKRALSYAPSLTEKILVTEEDSEESYQERPQWAKAVHPNDQTNHFDQPDTLTDLQREALYLAKDSIKDLRLIGEGQFGKVFKGVLSRGSESLPVAVKMTKKTISDYLQQSFIKEMGVMSEMMHPNIVRLYGLVTQDVLSPWIVLEYMEHGDLKSFLTNNQRSTSQLVKYMVDVAMGMHYISERGLVHRDLAARNVLVGTSEICKVADFGLLRETSPDNAIYQSQHNVPCPIRWMPPESISDKAYSAASDVWSFGILVWEMFNPTKIPYGQFDNYACITKVYEGYRMPIPRGLPSILAKIMKACWHKNPNKRPSFLLISTLLSTRTIM